MAGLLGQGFDDPQSSAIMALAGGLLQGNFGGGLLGANSAYQGAQDGLLKRQLGQAQLDNYRSEVETRRAQLAKQQQMQKLLSDSFGPAPQQPAQMGQLGSGSFGVVPPPAGQPQIPQSAQPGAGRLASMSPDTLALLKANGLDLVDVAKLARPDMQVSNGYAYDKNNTRPGFLPQLNVANNGQVTQVQVGPDGQPVVGAPRGSLEVYSQFRNADEAAKAQSDLTQVYNPATQRMEFVPRSRVLAGAGGAPSAMSPAAPAARAMPAQAATAQPGMTGNFSGDPAQVMEAILQIKDPQERANAMSAFTEQAKRTSGFAQGASFPPAGNFAAGPSTSEASTAAAGKEYATQTAKDVVEQRKAIMNAGFVAPSNIARYQQIGKLLSDVDGGTLTPTGTHLASMANSLGLKIDKNLPNKEAAASLANAAALELRNPAGGAGMPGALSDADRNFLASMTPNVAQSAQGRKQVIDAYIAVQTRSQQVAQFARKYEQKYGKLDNGFFEQMQAWSSANPIFKAQ